VAELVYTPEQTERLNPFRPQIESAVTRSFELANSKLPLAKVEVVIRDKPSGVIPEMGMVGSARNPNLIYISIDPLHPNLSSTIGSNLLKTLLHEYHHCARQLILGFPRTLIDALVSEGLADHFQLEITGGEPPPWSSALSDEQLQKFVPIMKNEFKIPKYDHRGWFFGSDDRGIPRWTGYSVGFQIVSDYLKSHPKETASSLYALSSELFIAQ